jgi:hypothetical protein
MIVDDAEVALAQIAALRAAIDSIEGKIVRLPWDTAKWGPHTPEREGQVRHHLLTGEPLPSLGVEPGS